MKRPAIVSSIALFALVGLLAFAWADTEPARELAEPTQELPEPAQELPPEDTVAMTDSITSTDCVNAWYDSQAVAWCTSQGTSVTSSNQCYLERECGNNDSNVTFTGSVSQVKRLHWCSSNANYSSQQGWLQVGDC